MVTRRGRSDRRNNGVFAAKRKRIVVVVNRRWRLALRNWSMPEMWPLIDDAAGGGRRYFQSFRRIRSERWICRMRELVAVMA